MKKITLVGLAATVLSSTLVSAAPAPKDTQFVPVPTYRSGPYSAASTAMFGGYMDYMAMLNARDAGINGVRLSWEICDTEYKTDRGIECYEKLKNKGDKGATSFSLLQTSLTYALLDKVAKDKIPLISMGSGRSDATDGEVFPYVFPLVANYWRQNAAKIQFIAQQEGGFDKLKGKKIVNLYHNSAYGKETQKILDAQAEKYGFDVEHFSINPSTGTEQQGIWLHIRRIKADWVILRGYGAMNPTALKEARRSGFPVNRIIGSAWTGSEEDVVPAGKAAKGFIAPSFNAGGADFRVITDIRQRIYADGKGNVKEDNIGSVYYNRGIVLGILNAEAIRTAQSKFGNKPLSGEQMRWGYENLDITDEALRELGAEGLMTAVKTSCKNHEGNGKIHFQQWDGEKWTIISDWMDPDSSLIDPLIEASAAEYARKNAITPRDCSKE